MKDVTVQLQGCLRQISGFPAVRSVLYLNSTQHHRLTTHTSIDFGLELTSGVEFAEEEIDGRIFRRKFPWVSTRMPGHTYRMLTPEPWEVLAISYDFSSFNALKRFGADAENPGWEFVMTDEITQKTARLLSLLAQTHLPRVADRIDLLSVDLLNLTLLENRENAQSPESTAIRQIASYFSAYVYEKIDIAAVIRKHNLSARTFFRHWKELYDVSPADFIMQRKMEEACRLLRETSMRIYEISERLQFIDCSHFCRSFRQWNQITPLNYRRRQ